MSAYDPERPDESAALMRWAEGYDLGLAKDLSQQDAIKAAAWRALHDPEVEALWEAKVPELAHGLTPVMLPLSVAVVIGQMLDGTWVPRKVRQEAQRVWLYCLGLEREYMQQRLTELMAELEATTAERTDIRERLAELNAQLRTEQGLDAIDPEVAQVLDGLHRRAGTTA